MCRALMDVNRRPRVDPYATVREQTQTHVNPHCRRQGIGFRKPIAARDCAFFDTDQIDGAPLAGAPAVCAPVLSMDAAHTGHRAARHDRYPVASMHPPRKHGTRHDGTVTVEGKYTIHREPKQSVITPGRRADSGFVQEIPERCGSGIVLDCGVDSKDCCLWQASAG